MLHTEVVEGTTLELLKRLQAEKELQEFCLAGGTALSLYMGHRYSVDLDLFTPRPFDNEALADFLKTKYGFEPGWMSRNTLKGTIAGVKIDCIRHGYPHLAPYCEDEGIRLYSEEDIIAMKLSAITDNGTRMKDFIDIAYLSTRFSLVEMLGFYRKKFSEDSVRALKSLTYFNDVDTTENIALIHGDFNWEAIEQRLRAMTEDQGKVFEGTPLVES
ncbi:MAG: nucleotidyl transferase AbiEii/AbiGii toxin family protein [Bacteroides sp.]|nr:nucleotidyl transferase AbiEii/AbiGii toxin family protein [Ruminococcus flavefaciens]MCM1554058.1 nucleotidyl transferase AbiEii/AbiGii toxin family protein [Bacteroides sp.]